MKQIKYSIRKTVLGVGSVAIASLLFLAPEAIIAQEGQEETPVESVETSVEDEGLDEEVENGEQESDLDESTPVEGEGDETAPETEESEDDENTENPENEDEEKEDDAGEVLETFEYFKLQAVNVGHRYAHLTSEETIELEDGIMEAGSMGEVLDLLVAAAELNNERYIETESDVAHFGPGIPYHTMELEDTKVVATELINSMEVLSEDSKTELTAAIEGYETLEQVDFAINQLVHKTVLTLAEIEEEDVVIDVESTRESAYETLETLENLSEEEKAVHREAIELAETVDEILDALSVAIDEDSLAGVPGGGDVGDVTLEDIKASTIEHIETAYTYLTDEQIDDFVQQVENAETQEEVEDIQFEAELLNHAQITDEDLAVAKDAAKAEIEELENLTDDEIAEFKSEIDEAATVPEINTIVFVATEQNDNKDEQEELDNLKEAALAELALLVNLTESELEAFETRINEAETVEAVEDIVEEATLIDLAREDLEEMKENVKEFINKLEDLTDEQKAEFIDRVELAEEVAEVMEVYEEAKALNVTQGLESIREEALEHLATLDKLPAETLEKFKGLVNDAETSREIDEILQDANVENFKYFGYETINKFDGITKEDKQEYVNDIALATTHEQIESILDRAEAQHQAFMVEAKELVIEYINMLTGLTQAQREAYIQAANNATTVAELETLLIEVTDAAIGGGGGGGGGGVPSQPIIDPNTPPAGTPEQPATQQPSGNLVESGDVALYGIGAAVLLAGGGYLVYRQKNKKEDGTDVDGTDV